jgi:hypothetical protein
MSRRSLFFCNAELRFFGTKLALRGTIDRRAAGPLSGATAEKAVPFPTVCLSVILPPRAVGS